ncbi:MAG: ABC-F family ATP-binding cassette domain-containing protein [Melioribacteraceae bacterium]|nr:ABC-F family ATP-binding cassette domain-containing protein [Melioribacteraceae bacterium]MCO6472500.1 ABC-F family ATP-binding cassette domain-containing protein [Melioribacteraceae bacterium]MDD3558112.1 ABC-F family ATP-binding cassette domain-containing protein [Melioribacteraceae bacterium]
MIDLLNLSVQFSGEYLFENVNVRINPGDKIALVGSNGSGKSTLLKIISGLLEPESGIVQSQKNIKIGYLPQELISNSERSIFEEVKSSISFVNELDNEESEIHDKLNSAYSLSEEFHDKYIHRLGDINNIKEKFGYYKIDSEIEKILLGLGFKVSDLLRPCDEFSGGWQMRVELAKILANENDLILLDEPTNHLDIDSLQWLLEFLQNFKGAILLVSHDKYFVNNVTTKTLEIFNKEVNFYKGKYDDYLNFKKERDEQLIARYRNQQLKIKSTERFIERFRYKNTKAKQVQSRIKQLEKLEKIELPVEFESNIKIRFPEPPRSTIHPVELENVTKSYGSLEVLKNINFKIERGEKIAFVGPNGAGKTTLARIIAGELSVTSGRIIIGDATRIAYYAQEVADNLDTSLNILESVSEISPDSTESRLRSILGSFLFSGDDVYKKLSILSGGEKSRVALARILLTKANLIVLDEPTNHLDVQSKEILQNALVNYTGSLIIVSHDVDFLRPVIDKVIEIRPMQFKYYYGGIDYYLQKKFEETHTFSEKNKPVEIKVNKKEQKRIEAEIRQKKFSATKELKQRIDFLEKEIEKLEDVKTKLESELLKESVYLNPVKLKDTNQHYTDTKTKLEKAISEWTEKSDELSEIEKSFKENFN